LDKRRDYRTNISGLLAFLPTQAWAINQLIEA